MFSGECLEPKKVESHCCRRRTHYWYHFYGIWKGWGFFTKPTEQRSVRPVLTLLMGWRPEQGAGLNDPVRSLTSLRCYERIETKVEELWEDKGYKWRRGRSILDSPPSLPSLGIGKRNGKIDRADAVIGRKVAALRNTTSRNVPVPLHQSSQQPHWGERA